MARNRMNNGDDMSVERLSSHGALSRTSETVTVDDDAKNGSENVDNGEANKVLLVLLVVAYVVARLSTLDSEIRNRNNSKANFLISPCKSAVHCERSSRSNCKLWKPWLLPLHPMQDLNPHHGPISLCQNSHIDLQVR